MSIQRYSIGHYDAACGIRLEVDAEGDCVLHTDHAAEVERLMAERDALDQGMDQANADTEETRKEMVQWREWCIKAQAERDAAVRERDKYARELGARTIVSQSQDDKIAEFEDRGTELEQELETIIPERDSLREQLACLKMAKAMADAELGALRQVKRERDAAVEALRHCRAEIAYFQRLAHGKQEFPPTNGMVMADTALAKIEGEHNA